MQFSLPGAQELIIVLFVALAWTLPIIAAYRLVQWIVARETKELRQRVALLEYEVQELREEGEPRTRRASSSTSRRDSKEASSSSLVV